jgi:DNA repair protein RadC
MNKKNLGIQIGNTIAEKTIKPLSYPTEETAENKPFFHGHRARERERIMRTPFGELSKRDLLEVLLYYSIPRNDTKPIAERILHYTSGNIHKMLFFDEHDIRNIKGLGDSFLCLTRILRELLLNAYKEEFGKNSTKTEYGTQFDNWQTVYRYLQTQMAYLNVEHFRLMILDNNNFLIKDCLLSQGTVNHASVYIREVVKAVLDNFGVSVILAHNHPSGDVTPSQSDIDITKNIVTALNTITVRVQDHIIIGGNNTYSFVEHNLI